MQLTFHNKNEKAEKKFSKQYVHISYKCKQNWRENIKRNCKTKKMRRFHNNNEQNLIPKKTVNKKDKCEK